MEELPRKVLFRPDVEEYLQAPLAGGDGLNALKETLAVPPMFTTLRINTLRSDRDTIRGQLNDALRQDSSREEERLEIIDHDVLDDVLFIPHKGPRELSKLDVAVVVGLQCGEAVLRGAHVFAQGVIGAPAGMQAGCRVSVFADVDGACRKGCTKPFDGRVAFVGNGVAEMSRHTLFCSAQPPSGVAIRMQDALYVAPSLSGVLPALVFPQNLPSTVCAHVLAPQPHMRVLDMCAAPGGKTTHIATLMRNTGRIVACDKNAKKISRIKENASTWNLETIEAYATDSTKLCSKDSEIQGGPPFPPSTFDRILLDAPCSALGQRPALSNPSRLRDILSFPPLQKKLFCQAVELLKEDGVLVYSTCTFLVEENESLVSWALKSFPDLQLARQEPHLGGSGRPGTDLTESQRTLLQRFFPEKPSAADVNSDTIGFFIAKFVKRKRVK